MSDTILNHYPNKIRKLQAKVSRLYHARFVVGVHKYQRYARKLKRDLAQLSLQYEDKIACSRNNTMFYKFVNKKLNLPKGIGTILNSTGELCKSEEEKAKTFASFFKTVYKRHDNNEISCKSFTLSKLDFVDINSDNIYRTLKKLPVSNSTSPDNIPYIFLNKAAIGLTPILNLLFNRFLLHGEVPSIWRTSFVKPIFKKREQNKCRKLQAYLPHMLN